jgi:hypothetical protein
MKAGVTPVLTAVWWKANKGNLVPGAPLEGALQTYEKLKATFERTIEAPNAAGYDTYIAVKTYLGADLMKAMDAQINACNKTLHKDTIAGLTKYKTAVIPAEKAALDKAFNGFKERHEGVLESMRDAVEHTLALLDAIGKLSVQTVLECEAKAPEVDKALAAATVAKANADKDAADAAMNAAINASTYIVAKRQVLANAIKNRPKEWAFDRTKLTDADGVFHKLSDRKLRLDTQIENNWQKVEEITKQAQATTSETRKVADGSVHAETALVGAFNRVVNRAYQLGQTNDVPAREMKAALSNLEGDLEAYAKTHDAAEKAKFKQQAGSNLLTAKTQQTALKNALGKGKAEIDGLVKAMPAKVVHAGNPAFSELFEQLDRATKTFAEDEVVLAKATEKIKKLEPEVAKLT